MIYVKLAVIFAVSYLLGSLSFAIIISKGIYKKDIRKFGSGNAGMTNILRTFGKTAAALTLAGDMLKGAAAVGFAKMFMAHYWTVEIPQGLSYNFLYECAVYIAAFGAFIGHLYPIYFGFKGGKGISVACGAMMAATPLYTSLALGIFIIIVFTSRIVSLASIISSCSYLVIVLISFKLTGTFSLPNLVIGIVIPAIIVYAHRSNIKRLLNGTEYRFGQKK